MRLVCLTISVPLLHPSHPPSLLARWQNPFAIARAYQRLGKKVEAKEWAQRCVDRPCAGPEDEDIRKEAEALLKSL